MPSAASKRHRQQRQQGDVLARDGEQVAEPGAAEVFDRGGVDALVLAEDEAARKLGLALGHAAAEGALGASADLVAMAERQERPRRRCRARRARTGGRRRTPALRAAGAARSDSIVAGPIPLT